MDAPTPTPTPTRTRHALRALADGTRRADPERVVEEATTALESVETAARFLADGGEARLAAAVAQAVREDDCETVRQGRRALATLRAFSAALAGDAVESSRP
jgi:hypothetical protein